MTTVATTATSTVDVAATAPTNRFVPASWPLGGGGHGAGSAPTGGLTCRQGSDVMINARR